MPDRFGNLNKYERAYLRSEQRRKRRHIQQLQAKKSIATWFKQFFFSRIKKANSHGVINLDHRSQLVSSQENNKQEQSPFNSQDQQKILMEKKQKKSKRTLKNKKNNKNKKLIKNIFFILAGMILLVFIAIAMWFVSLEIPDVRNFEQRKISSSTKIYDKTGEIILYDIHENIQRSVVDFKDINQYAKDAIIAIEDHNFYEHNGIVIKSTLRGVFQTLLSKLGLRDGGSVGGSTLTQQVVKNTILNSQKQVSRKVKEWVLAYKIEQSLSKDQILEIYLNEAPYGGTIYGIEEASREFFGISASEINLPQAAYLAAIPNLPTFYSPYGPNKDKLDQRQKIVLREMKRYGYISDEQYREALTQEVEFLSQQDNEVKALHFVQYIRAYLEEQYGQDLVENGGLKVITTLDYKLQKKAEDILKEHIQEVEEEFNASNAALIAIESETGHIISMVGSRDYFDTDIDGNFNVTLAHRQPGSSFKPIAYANAFERGYLPETVVFDVETQFNSGCSSENNDRQEGCYIPKNFDNQFKGPLSLRNALAQSRNIPAVKTLYLGGIRETLKLAADMGINSLNEDENYYGLGLVLGGGEVSLLDLSSAYSVFANEGRFNKATGIISVEDAEGNILEKYQANEQRVLSENSARMISSILSDNQARTPLFGSQSFLYFGERDVAAKTGTTNDNRDALLLGYIPQVAVGVWTGNNDNSPMKKGSSISGKPWRRYMDELLKEYELESFNPYDLPENLSQFPAMVQGQWENQYLSTTINPQNQDTNSRSLSQFNPHTILHWIDKDNPEILNTSASDPQYRNWEYGVRNYIQENFAQELISSLNVAQENLSEEDTVELNLENIDLIIEGIEDQETFESADSPRVSLSFQGIDEEKFEYVDFFINNTLVETDSSEPFARSINFDDMINLNYENTLELRAYIGQESLSSEKITFFMGDISDEQIEFVDL